MNEVYNGKFEGEQIDALLEKVQDGSVVIDNTVSSIAPGEAKPASSDAIAKELRKKVDAEIGKGLSSNDYTDEEKSQVERVSNGSVVTDNTMHEVTDDDTKPVTGAGVRKYTSKSIATAVSDLISGEQTLTIDWLDGYIDVNGNFINDPDVTYKHSAPIFLRKGDIINVCSYYYLFGAISLTDKSASYYNVVASSSSGNSLTYQTYKYEATDDCYVVVGAYADGSESVTIFSKSIVTPADLEAYDNRLNGALSTLDVEWVDGYIDFNGNLISSSGYRHSHPISVKRGHKLRLTTRHYGFCVFAKVEGDTYIPLLNATDYFSSIDHSYEYVFNEDCNVVVSGYYSKLLLEVGRPPVATEHDVVNAYRGDINLFDFRTIVGKSEWLYKDSLMSGIAASDVCDIRCDFKTASREFVDNWSSKAIRFKQDTVGTTSLVLTMTLPTGEEKTKVVNVEVVDAPAKKLASRNKLKVLFMGDSLIFFNKNTIGKEWLRMLNTSDSESHTTDGAIQLPTLNACDGKITLYGELGNEDNKYTKVAGAYAVFDEKRTSTSGAVENFENPFYNPTSTEADEAGEDGLNKRVDFGWWFDNNIGPGEYPNLIYLAMGPNDFANIYSWSEEGIDLTTERVMTICRRLKAECDNRAGGDSGLIIKIVQHQFYPPKCQTKYNFPIARQRYLWQKTAQAYIDAIRVKGMDSYVELIPVASRFDWEVGYSFVDESYNERYEGVNDKTHCTEATHMNTIGAYNYADVLVTDFLADSRFD